MEACDESRSSPTADDEVCLEHFQRTHKRPEKRRCVVRRPFNERERELGDSWEMALRHLLALERGLDRRPELTAGIQVALDGSARTSDGVSINGLGAFLDLDDGGLRVNGQIKRAFVPNDGRHQMLLSPEALGLKLNVDSLHIGRRGSLAVVRQRFEHPGEDGVTRVSTECGFQACGDRGLTAVVGRGRGLKCYFNAGEYVAHP